MQVKRIASGAALATALIAALTVTGPASAHHSFSMFDLVKEATLVGTIKEFQWTNPHSWIELDVANTKGAAEQWGIEGMSPNFLARRGWSRDTLKPGDKVSVVIHPLKDGSHGGSFVRVILPNGAIMKQSGIG